LGAATFRRKPEKSGGNLGMDRLSLRLLRNQPIFSLEKPTLKKFSGTGKGHSEPWSKRLYAGQNALGMENYDNFS